MNAPIRHRVIVLDDSPTVLAQVEALLGARFELHTTTQWVEANALAHSKDPDALVVDWNLDGFEGTYLISAFRRFFGPELPIVMLSGEENAQAAADAAGASAFIPKSNLPALGVTLAHLILTQRSQVR